MAKSPNNRVYKELSNCLNPLSIKISTCESKQSHQLYEQYKLRFLDPTLAGTCDFDNRLRTFTSGRPAIKAFNKLMKGDFYIREGLVQKITYLCEGYLPKYEDIRVLRGSLDYYFFDKDMNWTFMITHEADYVGDPFFLNLND